MISPAIRNELIEFAQNLVRCTSLSGQEGEVAALIQAKMTALRYEEVSIDSMGNVLGRIGTGEKSILFDSHMDTVEVNDEAKWSVPPFSGEILTGRLYGRGAVDMKSAVAASVYAGALAKKIGIAPGKSVYV
jgi:acetylornithine deacetylase/succinyl-diaminopimelate desuccinylase-like protein